MKALQLVEPGRPLVAREVPEPEPAPGEAVVRVAAAGICHSDVHYRSGTVAAGPLPITPGHEVAGVVERCGSEVTRVRPGQRVALDYLRTCGECADCRAGAGMFCPQAAMLGKDCNGGYAELLAHPERSLLPVPDGVEFDAAAVMMCSTATALHALRKARLRAGETVALFGFGGLGFSALMLARLIGAQRVFAVERQPAKLERAAADGAEPIAAADGDPVAALRAATGGRGVDVAIELVGSPAVMLQAVRSLAPRGRAALVGLTPGDLVLAPYRDLLTREAEVIGVSDHTHAEVEELLDWAATGRLDVRAAVSRSVALEEAAVNAVLDELERGSAATRVTIHPNPMLA